MPEIIELRVHGVGGTPGAGLLGVESEAQLVQVGGEGQSAFMGRRRDRSVEGYVWGRLTSRLLLAPLWLVLLPFTLINVAGWMHRPHHDASGRWFPLVPFRIVLEGIGIGLTMTYVAWTANLVMSWTYDQTEILGWRVGPNAKVLVGGGLLLALIALVVVAARMVQAGFEEIPSPVSEEGVAPVAPAKQSVPGVAQVATEFLRASLTAPATIVRVLAGVSRAEGLPDPAFWSRSRHAQRLLYVHAGAAFLTAAGIIIWALSRAGQSAFGRPESLRLARFATWTTEVLLLVLPLLFLLQFGWRRPLASEGFRWFGPGVVAVTAVGLATGLFYGLTLLFLGDSGRVAALGTAFGAATFGWAIGIVGLGIWLWRRAKAELRLAKDPEAPEHVRPNTAGHGREPTGATEPMYRRIAWRRAFSEAARNGDVVLTGAQLVFVLTALWQLRVVRPEEVTGLAVVGNWVAAAGAGATLFFLFRRAFGAEERRLVGILWDVLTFWPRRFHPLAVHPYAERAVPELEHRLVHHVQDQGRRVILSAHSQGTVLAWAALVQLPNAVTKEVALVTYGSPLRQLHAMAFPAYFNVEAFHALRTRLFDDGHAPTTAWRSFYRRTDYIGKTVFENPAFEDEVPDPAREPDTASLPLSEQLPSWPDPPRSVWVDIAAHSFYNSEELLKRWLDDLRGRLK